MKKILDKIYWILKLMILIFFAAFMIGGCIYIYQRIKYPNFFTNTVSDVGSSEEASVKDFAKDQNNSESQKLFSKTEEKKTNFAYNSLSTEEEKFIYKNIKENIGKITTNTDSKTGYYEMEPLIFKNCKLNIKQITWILYAVTCDNPDFFWVSNLVRATTFNNGNLKINLFSIFSLDDKIEKQKTLDSKLTEILNKIPKSSNDYAKELFLHDYIITKCKYYIKPDTQVVYTSYGCLVEGEAVCQGYSKAFQLLLSKARIDCHVVVGTRMKENHMWNAVKIGENWYHVDVTWDKEDLLHRYTYFNVTEDIIKKDHALSSLILDNTKYVKDTMYNFNIPKCDSLKENYFEKNAVKLENTSNFNENKKNINNALKKSDEGVAYIKTNPNLNFDLTRTYLLDNVMKFFNVNNKNKIQLSHAEISNQNIFAVKIT